MRESGNFSEKYSTGLPDGLTSTAPITPILFSTPSHAPSVKINQVLRFVAWICMGGAVSTRSLRNFKAFSSLKFKLCCILPWEAKPLTVFKACWAILPCAKLSNHCSQPLKRSASLMDITPAFNIAPKAFDSSSTLDSVCPMVINRPWHASCCLSGSRSSITPSVFNLVDQGTAFFPSFAKTMPSSWNKPSTAFDALPEDVLLERTV